MSYYETWDKTGAGFTLTTQQTVPSADNEKKMTLFNRANRLRFACEFDKAAGIYEAIVADFPEEAEAYWGLVLCKYGIEYVDDPATAKKIPTCHRSSFDSVMDDGNYEQTLENAALDARKVYRAEAKQIEELRKGIIEVSSKEDPYDIFICYKETDANGDRTLDSVLSQDIYDALTEKGYRTFFARITLEDKLGQEYEPYIFAALNSAKVMLTVGTDYEHYNAVWVKNEWSRFLHLIASGQKKTLIPCYKNIDAYDMPKEFLKLQAQDLGKVGAVQDLMRGIDKILQIPNGDSKQKHIATENAVRTIENEKAKKKVENAVYLGCMALDSQDTEKAISYFEDALKIDSECIGAYLGLVRAISEKDKYAPYVKKIKDMPVREVIRYVDAHRFLIGDVSKRNNLLSIAVNPIYSEALTLGLLEMGVNGNAVNALMYSVEAFDNIELTKAFIRNGADVNASSSWWYYCKPRGDDKYGHHETEFHSVLSMAIRNQRSLATIKSLVDAGADVNYVIHAYLTDPETWKCRKRTWSASILNKAVLQKNYNLVEFLLENGSDMSQKRITYCQMDLFGCPQSENHYSLLSDTIWNSKDIKMMELLLEHGANPNECDLRRVIGNIESNPLADAILFGDNSNMVSMLLKYGANPKGIYYCEGDYVSKIPVLGLAVEKCRKDVVSILIEAGASFSEQVSYTQHGKEDRFTLGEYAYGSKVLAEMEGFIRQYGWRGSKDGLFRKAHYCRYHW